MKVFFKSILLLLSIFTLSCTQKLDEKGPFSIYKVLGNSSKLLLVIKGEKETYTFERKIGLHLETLRNLDNFLVDNNSVYSKFEMDDGNMLLTIAEADPKTFQIFKNSIYAKDQCNIYDYRNGKIVHADLNTFRTLNSYLAKDKNHYYYFSEIISDSLALKYLEDEF
jgi:thioredoxin-related protein